MADLGDDDTDISSYLSSIPPSEDRPDTPEDYHPFFPGHGHDHAQFADRVPQATRMAAGPYAGDVTPYEEDSEQDDTSTMTSLSADESVPGHVAQALNNPGFRCLTAQEVHNICVGVSRDFIQNFRYNIEQRLSESLGNAPRRFPDHVSISDETARSLYRSTHLTASLTANTTAICSILWARGNALQMLHPESVSRALDDMSTVNAAAEDIATLYDITLRREDVQELEVRNVLQAGMEFCERLGYSGSREDLEGLALGFSASVDLGL